MSLRPNARKRRAWPDDAPPPPLGSDRAQIEAQEYLLEQYEEQEAENDNRASPSYRRPDY
jgi:hypothetical protein